MRRSNRVRGTTNDHGTPLQPLQGLIVCVVHTRTCFLLFVSTPDATGWCSVPLSSSARYGLNLHVVTGSMMDTCLSLALCDCAGRVLGVDHV